MSSQNADFIAGSEGFKLGLSGWRYRGANEGRALPCTRQRELFEKRIGAMRQFGEVAKRHSRS